MWAWELHEFEKPEKLVQQQQHPTAGFYFQMGVFVKKIKRNFKNQNNCSARMKILFFARVIKIQKITKFFIVKKSSYSIDS